MSGSFSRVGPPAPIEPRGPFRVPLITGAHAVPTVDVVNAAHPQGFITINASDFDPAVHVKYDPSAPNTKARSTAKAA